MVAECPLMLVVSAPIDFRELLILRCIKFSLMHDSLMAVTKEVPMQSSNSALPRSVARVNEVTAARSVSSSITRRSVVAGLAVTTAPMAVLAAADSAQAQATQTVPEKSLYERLGGVFAIAAVVDHFSDAVVKNPIVGQQSKNPQLREWHTKNLGRLPGLKFMRTLWVCNVSGGPFQFTATKPGKTPLGLEEAHRELRISPAEFDEVAAELGRSLDFAKVPKREKAEVLAAFAAHKDEVTAGYVAKRG
jgi:hemoglobin